DAHHSAVGLKCCFEHVRIRDIAPPGLERDPWLENERATATDVEDLAEDAGRVDIRKAPPVDGAIDADQRRCPAVTDEGVVADGQITVDAHEPLEVYAITRARRTGGGGGRVGAGAG